RNVVRDLAVDEDAAVEASGPLAVLQDIPDADARRVEARDALGVGKLGAGVEELAHERPEEVVRMRVGLAHLERLEARHRAEHEHAAAGGDLRRKARDPDAGLVARAGPRFRHPVVFWSSAMSASTCLEFFSGSTSL